MSELMWPRIYNGEGKDSRFQTRGGAFLTQKRQTKINPIFKSNPLNSFSTAQKIFSMVKTFLFLMKLPSPRNALGQRLPGCALLLNPSQLSASRRS